MGIFSGLRKSNSYEINEVSSKVNCGWEHLGMFRPSGGKKNFSMMYMNCVYSHLFSGISNVTFTNTKSDGNITSTAILSFIENNATLMIYNYINDGYIAVSYDKDLNFKLLDSNEVKKGNNGQIVNKNTVVYYSPEYQTRRKSPMFFAMPICDTLNNLCNTLNDTTNTMGTLPIISGQSIPANPEFKEKLADAMSKKYGYGDDKLKYFLSQTELKVNTIDLHIKDLELRDNITEAFKSLLNYFEIPVDIVMGNSTFNNVREARRYFYDNTIRKYAEILLKIARNLLTSSNEYIPQKSLTYNIWNVQGLEKSLSDMCGEKTAYVDLLAKLKQEGIDTNEELARIYNEIRETYKNI